MKIVAAALAAEIHHGIGVPFDGTQVIRQVKPQVQKLLTVISFDFLNLFLLINLNSANLG